MIANALGVEVLWLQHNKGPRYKVIQPSLDIQASSGVGKYDANVTVSLSGKRLIPVIDTIQAGRLKEINDPYSPGDGFDVEYCDSALGKWTFALEISGESMLPEFRPGDRVIIDPDIAPNPGELPRGSHLQEIPAKGPECSRPDGL